MHWLSLVSRCRRAFRWVGVAHARAHAPHACQRDDAMVMVWGAGASHTCHSRGGRRRVWRAYWCVARPWHASARNLPLRDAHGWCSPPPTLPPPLVPPPSGTGKTLAFLLPIIQQLKDDEMTHRIATRLKRPRALVVAPSRELAQQILVRHSQPRAHRRRAPLARAWQGFCHPCGAVH